MGNSEKNTPAWLNLCVFVKTRANDRNLTLFRIFRFLTNTHRFNGSGVFFSEFPMTLQSIWPKNIDVLFSKSSWVDEIVQIYHSLKGILKGLIFLNYLIVSGWFRKKYIGIFRSDCVESHGELEKNTPARLNLWVFVKNRKNDWNLTQFLIFRFLTNTHRFNGSGVFFPEFPIKFRTIWPKNLDVLFPKSSWAREMYQISIP